MQTSDILFLHAYNTWANHRILEAAAKVSDAQFLEVSPFYNASLRNILVHVMGGEWIWRMRAQKGISPPALLNPEDYPTVFELRSRWEQEMQATHAYLLKLNDVDLQQEINFRRTSGGELTHVLWKILSHLLFHGMQHRAEAAALLTAYGHSPGDIDLLIYIRQFS